VVEPLSDVHDIANFASGREPVDSWFREKALANSHAVSTYVCLDEKRVVCGFFALRAIVVNTSALSSRLKRAGDSQGMATAIMLAQMGLHEQHQGNGHGSQLFFRAVKEALGAYHVARIQLLVLDAVNENLVPFYEKHGMKRIPNSLRLVAPLNKIIRANMIS
jgi:GNAT superfamily N-acetyltransferase